MFDMWYFFTIINQLSIIGQFLIGLLLTSIAVEAITEILVSSVLLDVIGLRPWVRNLAVPASGDFESVRWYHTAAFKLLTCGYCTSVWMAMALSWCVPGSYFGMLPWDNIVIKIFLIHRLANYLHVRYELLRRGRVNTMDIVMKLDSNNTVTAGDEDARGTSSGDGEAGE